MNIRTVIVYDTLEDAYDENDGVEVNPSALRKGMIFRMYQPDGTPYMNNDKNYVFIADSNYYLRSDNIPAIMVVKE